MIIRNSTAMEMELKKKKKAKYVEQIIHFSTVRALSF